MLDIKQSIKSNTLYKDVRNYIANHSRNENILLYDELVKIALNEPYGDEIDDVLDAMSGWCHPDYKIGTGDYHV